MAYLLGEGGTPSLDRIAQPPPQMTHDHSSSTRTDWSMIAAAVAGEGDMAAEEAMERLARRYWPAVYAYVRSTGRNVHEAADLTQGFMCDIVIARRLFELADPKRGRFRSLLLTALKNYIRDESRTKRRRSHRSRPEPKTQGKQPPKRRARAPFILKIGDLNGYEPAAAPSPEAAFAAQWTALLVRGVLEQVRLSCLNDGLEPHWTIFEHRVVRPMLFGEEPMPYSILAQRLDLDDPTQGPNMMVTVKRRFARALYLEVCTTVDNSIEVEGELFELLRDLERQ